MTRDQGGGSITSVLQETRVFPPPDEFARKAHIGSLAQYEALWNRAKDDPAGVLGRPGEAAGLEHAVERRCSNGSRRSPSGSSAGSSTRL